MASIDPDLITCTGYIADGFTEDCDKLMLKCSRVNTLSFKKFCDIWKEMHFYAVFYGRSTNSELAELSEELLHIAKGYFLRKTVNFEETVAGLFLVYCLYNIQPFERFASVRFVPEDVPALLQIESEARRRRRLDVLYILGYMLIKGSQFLAVERERGIEFPIRKYLEVDNVCAREAGVLHAQSPEMEMIKELEKLDAAYKLAKADLGLPDKSLNYVDEQFGSKLRSSLLKAIMGQVDSKDDDDDESDSCDETVPPPRNVQSIKQKAMQSSIQPMKHLVGINSRAKTLNKSLLKTALSNQARKKRLIESREKECHKYKREKIKENQQDVASVEKEHVASEIDNPLESNKAEEAEPKKDMNKEAVTLSKTVPRDDDLETIITFSDDNFYNKASTSKTVNCNRESDVGKDNAIDQNQVNSHSEDDDNEMDFINEMYEITQVEASSVKMSKRESKKSRVKSKFQRQGLLPVANFKEEDSD